MSKKIKSKKDLHDNNTIHVMNSIEATIIPKYNPYAIGYGIHQSKKHPKRSQLKCETQKMMKGEW